MNISWQLTRMAERTPNQIAVAAPKRPRPRGRSDYDTVTFCELDEDSSQIAAGLQKHGVRPGHRIVLMVRPGIDFIALTFALFKTGAVVVLIDPGMGRQHLLQCLQDVRPNGFVAIPVVQMARWIYRKRFEDAQLNVTVGRKWFGPFGPWDGPTLTAMRRSTASEMLVTNIGGDAPAAIIFTTGSTGPPKGVLYRHENFAAQVQQLQEFYQIQPGEIDLPGFPLFGLFNSAMGVSTIIPDMDPRKPAEVDPKRIVQAIDDWNVTQAFGSPAIWNVVGQYCEREKVQLNSLRRILSAGAPVPPHVLRRMVNALPAGGDMHTPYGATESLPVASIAASEVLNATAARSAEGMGTCVGRRFSGIQWRVIQISDDPILTIDDAVPVESGKIGELIVRGPTITREYVTRTESNEAAKIRDGQDIWHRLGDVGYLDDQERFWFCGRKAHRLETSNGTMFTVPCEAIINQHPSIYRSALVGIGPVGKQMPVIVAEPWPEHWPKDAKAKQTLCHELYERAQSSTLTRSIEKQRFLLHPSLPVDIRHNAKIFREQLGPWAEQALSRRR